MCSGNRRALNMQPRSALTVLGAAAASAGGSDSGEGVFDDPHASAVVQDQDGGPADARLFTALARLDGLTRLALVLNTLTCTFPTT